MSTGSVLGAVGQGVSQGSAAASAITTPSAQTQLANMAQLAAQVLMADRLGTVKNIPNALTDPLFNEPLLLDPATISAYQADLAGQLNSQSGGPTYADLGERIADVQIRTTAQGASTLILSLIDPWWVLLAGQDSKGQTFIQTDTAGYLWPPIDIQFPQGSTYTWRLCQLRYTISADMTQANGTLTFEDRIVSQLRQMSATAGGILQGGTTQSLGDFIQQLVNSANQQIPANIQLLKMIDPQDPNYNAPITNNPYPQVPTPSQVSKFPQLSKVPPWVHTTVGSNTSVAAAETAIAAGLNTLPVQPGSPAAYAVTGAIGIGLREAGLP